MGRKYAGGETIMSARNTVVIALAVVGAFGQPKMSDCQRQSRWILFMG